VTSTVRLYYDRLYYNGRVYNIKKTYDIIIFFMISRYLHVSISIRDIEESCRNQISS